MKKIMIFITAVAAMLLSACSTSVRNGGKWNQGGAGMDRRAAERDPETRKDIQFGILGLCVPVR